jgi:hypothetical protein
MTTRPPRFTNMSGSSRRRLRKQKQNRWRRSDRATRDTSVPTQNHRARNRDAGEDEPDPGAEEFLIHEFLPQRRKERKDFSGFILLSFSLRPLRLCGRQ